MIPVEIIQKSSVLQAEIDVYQLLLQEFPNSDSIQRHLTRLEEKRKRVNEQTNLHLYLRERYNALYIRFKEVSDLIVRSHFETILVDREDLQKELAETLARIDEISTLILMAEGNDFVTKEKQ